MDPGGSTREDSLARGLEDSKKTDLSTALIDDLREIDRLVEQLHASDDSNDESKEELRTLVQPNLPPEVLEFEPGWYEFMKQGIDRDLQLLRPGIGSGRSSQTPRFDVRALRRGGQELSITLQARSIPTDRRAFQQSAMAQVDGYWRGYLEMRMAARLRRHLPRGFKVDGITVADKDSRARRGSSSGIACVGWSEHDRTNSTRWLHIRMQLHDAVWPTVGADIWILVPASSAEKRQRDKRRRMERAWDELTHAQPYRPSPLQEIASLFFTVVCAQRSIKKLLFEQLEKYRGGSTSLLYLLNGQLSELPGYSENEKKTISEKLITIVGNSDWSALSTCLVRLLSVLKVSGEAARNLYRMVYPKCPYPPAATDIGVLLETASSLALQNEVGRFELVSASLSFLDDSLAGGAAKELLAMLKLRESNTPPQLARLLIETVTKVIKSRRRAGTLASALQDLTPFARELGDAEIKVLFAKLGQILVEDCPVCYPGVWRSGDQVASFLDAMASFEQLVDSFKKSGWNVEELKNLRYPLPTQEKERSAYPSTYWYLLQTWLNNGKVDNPSLYRCYKTEVAEWYMNLFYYYPGLRKKIVPWIERCGFWLRKDRSIIQRLALQVSVYLRQASAKTVDDRRQVLTAFCLIGATSRKDRASFDSNRRNPDQYDAIAAMIDLLPGQSGGASSASDLELACYSWMESALTCESDSWKGEWAALILRGMLEVDDDWRKWSEALSRLSGNELSPQELDARLQAFEVLAVKDQSERLNMLVAWFEKRKLLKKDQKRWLGWPRKKAAAKYLSASDVFKLSTAALRNDDDLRNRLLRQRVSRLWPEVPMKLAEKEGEEELKRFLDYCSGIKTLLTDNLRASVFEQYFSGNKISIGSDELKMTASIFFEGSYFPDNASDILRFWEELSGVQEIDEQFKKLLAKTALSNPPEYARSLLLRELRLRINQCFDQSELALISRLSSLVACFS
jgi:hypothetical protein